MDHLSSESLGKQQSNKKSLKRVTFNLNKSVTPSTIGPSALQINDEPNISNEFMELVAENDQLRSTISDIEKNSTFSNNLDQINKVITIREFHKSMFYPHFFSWKGKFSNLSKILEQRF